MMRVVLPLSNNHLLTRLSGSRSRDEMDVRSSKGVLKFDGLDLRIRVTGRFMLMAPSGRLSARCNSVAYRGWTQTRRDLGRKEKVFLHAEKEEQGSVGTRAGADVLMDSKGDPPGIAGSCSLRISSIGQVKFNPGEGICLRTFKLRVRSTCRT